MINFAIPAARAVDVITAIHAPDGIDVHLLTSAPTPNNDGDYDLTGLEIVAENYEHQTIPSGQFVEIQSSDVVKWANNQEVVFGPNTSDTWWPTVNAVSLTSGGLLVSVIPLSNRLILNPHNALVIPEYELVLKVVSEA